MLNVIYLKRYVRIWPHAHPCLIYVHSNQGPELFIQSSMVDVSTKGPGPTPSPAPITALLWIIVDISYNSWAISLLSNSFEVRFNHDSFNGDSVQRWVSLCIRNAVALFACLIVCIRSVSIRVYYYPKSGFWQQFNWILHTCLECLETYELGGIL